MGRGSDHCRLPRSRELLSAIVTCAYMPLVTTHTGMRARSKWNRSENISVPRGLRTIAERPRGDPGPRPRHLRWSPIARQDAFRQVATSLRLTRPTCAPLLG